MDRAFKVITSTEMARIEERAYQAGYQSSDFMENAGRSIAQVTERFILEHHLSKKITLLVGKGNNGGDALVAGTKLLELGYLVSAILLAPLNSCNPLCKKNADRFQKAGGVIHSHILLEGVLLDGLVGTGFQGRAEGRLAELIAEANRSMLPILSIDIPSGLNGNTGEIGSIAIHATATIFLGLPKLGCFIHQGWNCIGQLIDADFGLPDIFLEEANAHALLPAPSSFKKLLPPMQRNRHKYTAGYLLGVAGSPGMAGAAILSSYAALRTGSGIVRLFHQEEITQELFSKAPLELMTEPLQANLAHFLTETKRATACFVGPGWGKRSDQGNLLLKVLAELTLPSVIDADALYHLSLQSRWTLPKSSILTPHHGEMDQLIHRSPTLEACQQLVEEKQVTLLLKGAPTFILHAGQLPAIITHGTPGMATAGSGDVLTGIVASLLSQKLKTYDAALLGAYLHGLAGEAASREKSNYGMIASDIIENLPALFNHLA